MSTKLPTERDFDPYGGDLDAQCAWKNFGGLTLGEAVEKFRSQPEAFQEDFTHMGGRAFAFYFPVLDTFLRETVDLPAEEVDDRQSWIIPQSIKQQFQGKNLPYVRSRKCETLELCNFMLANIEIFADDKETENDLRTQWEQLRTHLTETY